MSLVGVHPRVEGTERLWRTFCVPRTLLSFVSLQSVTQLPDGEAVSRHARRLCMISGEKTHVSGHLAKGPHGVQCRGDETSI